MAAFVGDPQQGAKKKKKLTATAVTDAKKYWKEEIKQSWNIHYTHSLHTVE